MTTLDRPDTPASARRRPPLRPFVRTRLASRRLALGVLKATGDPVAGWLRGSPRTDVYALYERLRAAGPVVRSRTGMYAVTSRAACDAVLRSADFGVLGLDGAPAVPDPLLTAVPAPLTAAFLEMDPPGHTRLRRVVAPAFRPANVRAWQDRIESTMDAVVDRAERRTPRGTPVNLMSEIAAPFPIAVISDLLGIPGVDADRFARIGIVAGQALDGIRSVRHARALLDAGADLERLFTRLLDERAGQPRDDVLSVIAAARTAGTATATDAVATAGLLLIAGFETTVNLVGNAVAALHAHGLWRQFVEDPTMASGVVEETLRHDPPVQATLRIAHTGVDLLGTRLRPGDNVLVLLAAANRDPGVHTGPALFDPRRRDEPEHLAFSAGIHYCLGASLARLEAAVALRTLARRWPHLRLVGGARRRAGSTIRGYLDLPAVA